MLLSPKVCKLFIFVYLGLTSIQSFAFSTGIEGFFLKHSDTTSIGLIPFPQSISNRFIRTISDQDHIYDFPYSSTWDALREIQSMDSERIAHLPDLGVDSKTMGRLDLLFKYCRTLQIYDCYLRIERGLTVRPRVINFNISMGYCHGGKTFTTKRDRVAVGAVDSGISEVLEEVFYHMRIVEPELNFSLSSPYL